MPRQGRGDTATLALEGVFHPILPRMARDISWKPCGPAAVEQRVRPELIICITKPVALFRQGTCQAGLLELRQKSSIALEMLPPTVLRQEMPFIAPLITEHSL